MSLFFTLGWIFGTDARRQQRSTYPCLLIFISKTEHCVMLIVLTHLVIDWLSSDTERTWALWRCCHLQARTCTASTPGAVFSPEGEQMDWEAHGGKETKLHKHTTTSNFYEDQRERSRCELSETLMMHGSSCWEWNNTIVHFNLRTNEYSLKPVLKIGKHRL